MGLPPGGHMEYTSGGPQYVTPDGKKYAPNGVPIDAGSAPVPQAATPPPQTEAAPDPAPAASPGGAAAPVGGLVKAAPPASNGAGATGITPDPQTPDIFSGPNALRQGIGQRNPPNLSPILTGLRSIY